MKPVFNPYHPDFLINPYPVYEQLRHQPPFYDSDWGLTFFSRYDDVRGILKDPRFGRDIRQHLPASHLDPKVFDRIYPDHHLNWMAYIRNSFIDLEPPQHTRIKNLVRSAFARRAAETYRPRIEQQAREILTKALETGTIEIISEYATPIPLTVISDMLKIPTEMGPKLLEWSHSIVKLFDRDATPEDGDRAEQATTEFVEYLGGLVEERTAKPGTDLISRLIEARVGGEKLNRFEIIATSILLLNAGHEATVHSMGNSFLALATHPEAMEWLRQHPDQIKPAVEELLRYDSPSQMFERWVLEETEWEGIKLFPGQKVGLLFGAANRDPHQFQNADQLNFERDDNPHIAFGAGTHFCVGVALAKVELTTAISVWIDLVKDMEIQTEVSQLPRLSSLVFRGLRRLPMSIAA